MDIDWEYGPGALYGNEPRGFMGAEKFLTDASTTNVCKERSILSTQGFCFRVSIGGDTGLGSANRTASCIQWHGKFC